MKRKVLLTCAMATLVLGGLAGCDSNTSEPQPNDTAGNVTYLTTVESTENGSLIKKSDADGKVTLEVNPDKGYKLVDVIIDNVAKGSDYVTKNIKGKELTINVDATSNHTIKGLFALEALPTFAYGNGTETNPFKVLTFEDFGKLGFTYKAEQTFYFEQENDIQFNLTDDSYEPVLFKGIYNGNGKKITLTKEEGVNAFTASLFTVAGDATIENLVTVSSENCLLSIADDQWYHVDSESELVDRTVTLKKINCFGPDDATIQIDESNAAFLYNGHIAYKKFNLAIEDCHIKADVSNSATCTGAFIGGIYPGTFSAGDDDAYLVSIKNSSFTGTIRSKSQAGLIVGNSYGIDTYLNKKTEDGKGYTNTLDTKNEDYFKKHFLLDNVTLNGEIGAFDNTGRAVLGLDGKLFLKDVSDYYNNQITLGTNKQGFTKVKNALASSNLTVKFDNNGFYIDGDDYNENNRYCLNFNIKTLYADKDKSAAFNGRDISMTLVHSASGNAFDKAIKGENCGLFTKTEAKEKLSSIFTEEVISGLNYKYIFLGMYKIALYTKDNNLYFILDDTNDEGLSTYNENGKHVGTISNLCIYGFDSENFMIGFKTII